MAQTRVRRQPQTMPAHRHVHHAIEAMHGWAVKFANDWSMNLAGMIAYSLITAIFPILLTVLSLTGFVLRVFAPRQVDTIAASIAIAFPQTSEGGIEVKPLLQNIIQGTEPLAIVALIGLIWLGSNLFVTMENAFSIIFRVRSRDPISQRVMGFGMVLLLCILLPISLGAASLVTAGSDDFSVLLPHQMGRLLSVIGPLTSLGVLWLLFMAIYMIVPNFEVRFRQAWPGALAATLLFGALQLLFPLYFKIFLHGNTRYGAAAASILVVIVWLWFFALITVIGAQINAVRSGLCATPYDLAHMLEEVYENHDTSADLKRNTVPTRFRWLHKRLQPAKKRATHHER